MKEITNLVRSGAPYHVIMDMVASKIVSEALVMSYGSQREAARLLGIDRATVRKYSGWHMLNMRNRIHQLNLNQSQEDGGEDSSLLLKLVVG